MATGRPLRIAWRKAAASHRSLWTVRGGRRKAVANDRNYAPRLPSCVAALGPLRRNAEIPKAAAGRALALGEAKLDGAGEGSSDSSPLSWVERGRRLQHDVGFREFRVISASPAQSRRGRHRRHAVRLNDPAGYSESRQRTLHPGASPGLASAFAK